MAPRPKPAQFGAPASRLPGAALHDLAALVAELARLESAQLAVRWRTHLGGNPPAHLPRWLLARVLAYRLQAAVLGGLSKATLRSLDASRRQSQQPFTAREAATRDGARLGHGALLVREWKGRLEHVMILDEGFAWNGETYSSLSQVAGAITGTKWNGHRFFGLRKSGDA